MNFCLSKLGYLLSILLLAMSCYENQEGCLDIEATNFNVQADISCEDCCEFPELRLSIRHQVSDPFIDTTYNFSVDSVYALNRMDSFQICSLHYYLSDIQLLGIDEKVGVENQLRIFELSDSDTTNRTINDNFALINLPNISTRTIGNISAEGSFTGAEFRVGLPEDTRAILPFRIPDNHPLEIGDSTYYDLEANEYEALSLTLVRPALADTMTINILESEWQEAVVTNLDFEIINGFNTILLMSVDYRLWLEGLNINEATIEQIEVHLKSRIGESFELVEIR